MTLNAQEQGAQVTDGFQSMNPKALRAAASYDAKLAEIGKLQRLEPYVSARQKILHRCLLHGVEGLKSPNGALSGEGLNCCKVAAVKAAAQRKLKEFADSYDEKLAGFGRIVRVGDFVDAQTPILHKCLKHKQEHLIRPRVAVKGSGLICCRHEAGRLVQEKKSRNAALKYDSRIAGIGRVTRIGEYSGSGKPILHRCLIHNEEHLISPDNALQGKGLKCCKRGEGWDTIQNLLAEMPLAGPVESPTELYIFSVPDHHDWIKIGISVDIKNRARESRSKGMYGDLVASWQLSDRRQAISIETALLRDSHLEEPSGVVDHFGPIAGGSEIRRVSDIDALCSHVDEIVEPLVLGQIGWAAWCLQYVPQLSEWEREKLAELSTGAG